MRSNFTGTAGAYRFTLLAGAACALALPSMASAQDAEPELQDLCNARRQHTAWQYHQRMARLTRVLLVAYADLKREREQLGRFMRMVVEHKHKIGFKGDLLIEPKPQEPTKHQYDYDSATVFGFLQQVLGGSRWGARQFAQCRRGRAGASCEHDCDAQE